MFEQTVNKLVDGQIKKGILKEEDRNIYRYGYQAMIEFTINILVSVLLAMLFKAYGVVIVFTAAYLWIRGCAGGYHARTSLGCFSISACMLIGVIIVVQYISIMELAFWMPFVPEVIITPCILKCTPIPHKNRPVSENERMHFKRKVKVVYSVELLLAVLLQYLGKSTYALTILAVHMIIFIMVIIHLLKKD